MDATIKTTNFDAIKEDARLSKVQSDFLQSMLSCCDDETTRPERASAIRCTTIDALESRGLIETDSDLSHFTTIGGRHRWFRWVRLTPKGIEVARVRRTAYRLEMARMGILPYSVEAITDEILDALAEGAIDAGNAYRLPVRQVG